MRFKLDENLGHRGLAALQAAGHDVASVAGQDLTGTADHTIIDVCRREGRVLVTLDLGFGNPLRFPPERFPGIVVLRLPGRATPEDLDDATRTLIGALETREPNGRLWVVQRGSIREHRPSGAEEEPEA